MAGGRNGNRSSDKTPPNEDPSSNKATTGEDPEYVSMDTLKELLDQQRNYFEDLLRRQETAFRSFTQMVMDSNNKRVDSCLREIQELKVSLSYSQNEIDELKKNHTAQQIESRMINQHVNELKLEQSSKGGYEQMEYLENQCRRNNLVINGLGPDKEDETWDETEAKVQAMLATQLKIETSVEIERAHRNGKFRGNKEKPRTVVIKLLRFKDKQLILARAKAHLRNTSIYISEDFSDRVRKRRAELLPALREARTRGDYAIISYDRLIVRPRREGQEPRS